MLPYKIQNELDYYNAFLRDCIERRKYWKQVYSYFRRRLSMGDSVSRCEICNIFDSDVDECYHCKYYNSIDKWLKADDTKWFVLEYTKDIKSSIQKIRDVKKQYKNSIK